MHYEYIFYQGDVKRLNGILYQESLRRPSMAVFPLSRSASVTLSNSAMNAARAFPRTIWSSHTPAIQQVPLPNGKHSTIDKLSVARTNSPTPILSGGLPRAIPPPRPSKSFEIAHLRKIMNDLNQMILRNVEGGRNLFYGRTFSPSQ